MCGFATIPEKNLLFLFESISVVSFSDSDYVNVKTKPCELNQSQQFLVHP